MTTSTALAWLPPALLLALAASHFYLVDRYQMSPWLGGGFGMFATADVGSSRLLTVSAHSSDGREFPVTLNRSLDELKKRVRGLPSRVQAQRLADAILADLDVGSTGVDRIDRLTIEVWRTLYEPGSLRPLQTRIAVEHFTRDD